MRLIRHLEFESRLYIDFVKIIAFRYHRGNKSKVGTELQFIHCGEGELSRSESGLGSQIVLDSNPRSALSWLCNRGLVTPSLGLSFYMCRIGDNYGAVCLNSVRLMYVNSLT